jgi:hypothetical protein
MFNNKSKTDGRIIYKYTKKINKFPDINFNQTILMFMPVIAYRIMN